MKSETKRIEWIDSLRGIAMILVVLGHAFQAGGIPRKYIYSFHMPLFFFISGCTYKDTSLSLKEYAKKKSKGLLLPYIVINIINLIFYTFIPLEEDFIFLEDLLGIFYGNDRALSLPCGPSWFLLTIFISEIIFYLIKKYSKNDKQVTVYSISSLIIGLILSLTNIAEPWHIITALIGVFFYYLGYIFVKNIEVFKKLFNKKLTMFLLSILLFIISIISCFNNIEISMNGNHYGNILLFFISFFSAVFALILMNKIILEKSKILKNIGKNTLFILGYHKIIQKTLLLFFPFYYKSTFHRGLLGLSILIIIYPLSLLAKKYFPFVYGKEKHKKVETKRIE